MNEFLSSALLWIASGTAIVLLFLVGSRLEREQAIRGLRSGAILTAATIFVIAWLAFGLGNRLEKAELGASTGGVIMVLFGVALLVGWLFLFTKSWFYETVLQIEDQGWFSRNHFKPNQGWRVRTGTLLALLIVGLCGIITLISHRSLGSDRFGPNNWTWVVPFTTFTTAGHTYYRELPLLFTIHATVPIILGALLIWFSWRIVNYPVFADFLIATEAEINKVSWTTRKRLVQDTIVVLITVFLMSFFLFFIDLLWIQVLSAVNVLQVDIRAAQQKQQEKTQW